MIWQDLVITTASLILSISLIPQIYYSFKTKQAPFRLLTSVPTVIGLAAIVVCYLTLGLVLSAFITAATNIMWIVLLVQRIIYKNQNSPK